MNAAIYLHQHAFLAHALATDPMQWGSTSTGASHAGAYQDTPDRRAPQDDLFPLCQELG